MPNYNKFKSLLRVLTPPIFVTIFKKVYKQVVHRSFTFKEVDISGKYLYFGNLSPEEIQFSEVKFVGLALHKIYSRDVVHDAHNRLPCKNNSIEKIQAEDVFEHLEFERIPAIFDEIHRVLVEGGIFRLSVPDYLAPHNLADSFFDSDGRILGDTASGATITYDRTLPGRRVLFTEDGGAHLWFPTYELVKELVNKSEIKSCSEIIYHQYNVDSEIFVNNQFPIMGMPVKRVPPLDMRNNGKPVSIVVDFVK